MDTAIGMANDRLNFVSRDKEFLREYHLREMALSDWTTGVNTAFEKGMEKGMERGMEKGMERGREEGMERGREEGMERGREITARNALADGLSLDVISRITGLDIATIANMQ